MWNLFKFNKGTLRPEDKNGDASGRETETSFLVAVFRFRHQNITMLWRESENDTCKQIQNAKIENSQRFFIILSENIIDDEELLLLFDVNRSTNLDMPYWSYEGFHLQSWS